MANGDRLLMAVGIGMYLVGTSGLVCGTESSLVESFDVIMIMWNGLKGMGLFGTRLKLNVECCHGNELKGIGLKFRSTAMPLILQFREAISCTKIIKKIQSYSEHRRHGNMEIVHSEWESSIRPQRDIWSLEA